MTDWHENISIIVKRKYFATEIIKCGIHLYKAPFYSFIEKWREASQKKH